MLQEAQRTSAPRALRVSIRTAVWMVMWREPATRAPLSGFFAPYSARSAMRPGISVSAMAISLRPHSARPMSLTWWSAVPLGAAALALGAAVIGRLRRLAGRGPGYSSRGRGRQGGGTRGAARKMKDAPHVQRGEPQVDADGRR